MRLERRVAALEGPTRDTHREMLEAMSLEDLVERFVTTVRVFQESGEFNSPEWDDRIDRIKSGQSFPAEEWEVIKAEFARVY